MVGRSPSANQMGQALLWTSRGVSRWCGVPQEPIMLMLPWCHTTLETENQVFGTGPVWTGPPVPRPPCNFEGMGNMTPFLLGLCQVRGNTSCHTKPLPNQLLPLCNRDREGIMLAMDPPQETQPAPGPMPNPRSHIVFCIVPV